MPGASRAKEKEEHIVSRITACRTQGGVKQYRVAWARGAPTWEPYRNVKDCAALERFLAGGDIEASDEEDGEDENDGEDEGGEDADDLEEEDGDEEEDELEEVHGRGRRAGRGKASVSEPDLEGGEDEEDIEDENAEEATVTLRSNMRVKLLVWMVDGDLDEYSESTLECKLLRLPGKGSRNQPVEIQVCCCPCPTAAAPPTEASCHIDHSAHPHACVL
jgi:hypothetical protein